MHFHKRLCIGKVVSGEKYIEINNHVKIISRNEVFIIPPYIAHSSKTYGSIDYLVFCLDYNKLNNFEILSEGAHYLNIGLNEIVKLVNDTCNNVSVKNSIINYLIQYLEENYNCNIVSMVSSIASECKRCFWKEHKEFFKYC